MARRFTLVILGAMILGVLVGQLVRGMVADPADLAEFAGHLQIVTDLFLRLIKMIIAPLVLTTLVAGIAHFGEPAALGRVGVRTLLWFLGASFVSLLLGIVVVTLLQPGVGLGLPIPETSSSVPIGTSALGLKEFITHLVPKSIIEAMANNEILQIVVFSIFFGAALAALGERGRPVVEFTEAVAQVMLRVTGYVMLFAPFAVFAAVAATITTNGLSIIGTYGRFVGGFYAGLLLLWLLLIAAAALIVGRRVIDMLRLIREPVLLAFSTASSEAAYPKTLDRLQQLGASRRISSFVLPLGYSFNLDGSMMYCTFATIFIAQAYGIELTWAQKLTMLLLLMVTSKGMAGVPRASLVVIAATLAQFNIPEAGLLLVLAVDHFLDMGRSATNVVGNSVATLVIAKWENQLAPRGETSTNDSPPDDSGGRA